LLVEVGNGLGGGVGGWVGFILGSKDGVVLGFTLGLSVGSPVGLLEGARVGGEIMLTEFTEEMVMLYPSKSIAWTMAVVPVALKVAELAIELMEAACVGVRFCTTKSTKYVSVSSKSREDHSSLPGVQYGFPLLLKILLITVDPAGAPSCI